MEKGEVKRKTGAFLTDIEIEGVMARRDELVEHFEKLIAKRGEDAVIY